MNAGEVALKLGQPGENHKNCCQSALAALSDELGFKRELALKLGVCFGGGLMNGEVCGALVGALMYFGLKLGDSEDAKLSAREFIELFREKNGTLLCRELTDPSKGEKSEICPKLIVDTVSTAESWFIK